MVVLYCAIGTKHIRFVKQKIEKKRRKMSIENYPGKNGILFLVFFKKKKKKKGTLDTKSCC